MRMFTPRGKDTCVARVRSISPWAFCSSDSFLTPGPYSPHPPRLCKYSRGLGRNGIAHRIGHILGTVEHCPSRHAIAAVPLHHTSGLQQRSRSSRHFRATVTPRGKAPGQTFRCTSRSTRNSRTCRASPVDVASHECRGRGRKGTIRSASRELRSCTEVF